VVSRKLFSIDGDSNYNMHLIPGCMQLERRAWPSDSTANNGE